MNRQPSFSWWSVVWGWETTGKIWNSQICEESLAFEQIAQGDHVVSILGGFLQTWLNKALSNQSDLMADSALGCCDNRRPPEVHFALRYSMDKNCFNPSVTWMKLMLQIAFFSWVWLPVSVVLLISRKRNGIRMFVYQLSLQ